MRINQVNRRKMYSWDELPLVLSVGDVADLLSVSDRTIQKYCKNGWIKSRNQDGKIFISRDWMREWIEGVNYASA